MRIVYFSPHPTHDIVSNVGYSTHQREMIHALRDLGHEVIPVIVGGTTADELPPETQRGGSSSLTQAIKKVIPGILWRTLKDWFWMRHDRRAAEPMIERALMKHKPDLVYERSEYCLKAGAKWTSKLGVKHILEVNAPCVEEWIQFEGSSLLTAKANAIERYKYQHADGLCPVSSPLGAFLEEHYGVPSASVKVIPNAIRLELLKVDGQRADEIRAKRGWRKDDVVIGFVGSVLEYHGVDHLLDAFIELQTKHKNIRLMIVGDGQLLGALNKTVQKHDLTDVVSFTGKVPHDEVFNHIKAMDICVSPKHSWYGSPIKIFEYGAMGKAIIAPDDANIRDVLSHGESAHLIGKQDDDLKSALEQLIVQKDYRELLGGQAMKIIRDQHLWKNNAQALVDFAQSLPSK